MTSCGIVVNSCRLSCFCKNDHTEFDWLIVWCFTSRWQYFSYIYTIIWTLRYKKYSYERTYWNGESASWVCCSWWGAVLGSGTDTTRSSPECPCDLQGYEMKHVNMVCFLLLQFPTQHLPLSLFSYICWLDGQDKGGKINFKSM